MHCDYGGTSVRLYILYRGPFGEQIINNLALKSDKEKIVGVYELKPETIEAEHSSETNLWSTLWEDPEKYIPQNLSIVKCDLLLVLGIHSKLGDLIPPIAKQLNAHSVLYPICDRDMAPEAKKAINDELASMKIHVDFPKPFCKLDRSDDPYISKFVEKFGRPKFKIKLDTKKRIIKEVVTVRDTPEGSAHRVGQILLNFPYTDRERLLRKIYEEHHNESAESYCMAEMDPKCPLMQEAGDLLKDAIFQGCGFETTKDIILKKINELGEVTIKQLEEDIVNGAGDWSNPEKACDADRTISLYVDELLEEGKISKTSEQNLKSV